MFQFDASVAVKRMIEADLYGIPSHGCARFCEYLDAMDLGDIDPRARVLVLDENDVMTIMDGSRAIGHVAATKGMESAIAKAKKTGVGVTAVGNSQTLGAASVYARMAVGQGMIGICMTSTGGATLSGIGSYFAAVGNSAFAYGVPIENAAPLIFDAACGAESWGKLQLMKRYGRPIPDGILFDEQHQTVNSMDGKVLMAPAGGELGFGLSLLCSILAGPLAMGRMAIKKTRSASAEDSQHFFIVLKIESFLSPDKFQKNLQAGLDEIRQLPPSDPTEPIRLPGERGQRCFHHFSQNGIPFHNTIVNEIRDRAKQLGVVTEW